MKVLKIEIWEDKRNVLIYIEYEDDFNKDDLKAKLRNQVDKNFNYEIILIKTAILNLWMIFYIIIMIHFLSMLSSLIQYFIQFFCET